MKYLKRSTPLFLLFLAVLGFVQIAPAQKKSAAAKDSLIKSLVDNQRYIFYAQNVTPMGGRQRFLTSDYTVYISKDTVASDLPYFGRAYSAPINPTDGGIKFTSTNFDYQSVPAKKGGWNITIKPKDMSDVQQLILNVYANGNAYLQVISNNRQSISFNGYITAKKNKK